ncbi:DUF4179 domain-containing protein [Clostridiaceae bacterium UIB06]|nr:DUF4179 domain-containing protein [Clostridiaceae bacterium UIB06]
MDREVDLKIKDLLNINKDVEVPEEISKGVDEVLSKINNRHKKRNKIGKSIIAATVAVATITSLAVAFPTLAQDIPIVNRILGNKSIFNKEFEGSYDHFDNLKNVKDYSIGVEQTVKDKDISITLKEVAYDGVALYFIYDEQGKINDNINNRHEKSVSIGNMKIQPGAIIPQKIDDNTIRVTEIYPITETDKIPDKFNVIIDFNKIQDTAGSWKFNLSIDKNQLIKNTNKKDLNKKIQLGLFDRAKIISLTQTSAYATINIEHSNYKPDAYCYEILDENGNEVQEVDLGGVIKKGNKTVVTSFYKLSNDNKLSKIVVLKQKVGYFSPEVVKEKSYLEFNETLPKTFSVGKDKKITISKIEKIGDKYEVTILSKGISIRNYCLRGGISLYNREMDSKNHDAYNVVRADALGNNTYKITIDNKNKDFNTENYVLAFGNYDNIFKSLYEIDIK